MWKGHFPIKELPLCVSLTYFEIKSDNLDLLLNSFKISQIIHEIGDDEASENMVLVNAGGFTRGIDENQMKEVKKIRRDKRNRKRS